MKKTISTIVLGSMFAFTGALPSQAATPSAGLDTEEVIELADYGFEELGEAEFLASSAALAPCPRGTFRVRRSTRTKKKVINSAIAGAIGTAIGAGVGGKRGALIGAGSGAGGYLVYRYVRDRRGRCVRSYSR